MFNIENKNKLRIDKESFNELVDLIDPSLEKYKMPNYLTQHRNIQKFKYKKIFS